MPGRFIIETNSATQINVICCENCNIVVVTKSGPVNLMSKIPIEAEEIEQIMNR